MSKSDEPVTVSVSSDAAHPASRECGRCCRYFDVDPDYPKTGDCRATCDQTVERKLSKAEKLDKPNSPDSIRVPISRIISEPLPGGGFVSKFRGHETDIGKPCPYRGPYHYPQDRFHPAHADHPEQGEAHR